MNDQAKALRRVINAKAGANQREDMVQEVARDVQRLIDSLGALQSQQEQPNAEVDRAFAGAKVMKRLVEVLADQAVDERLAAANALSDALAAL